MASQGLTPSLVLPSPLDPTAKRVEIDEFIADEAMTNLFLLALQDMQVIRLKGLTDPNEDWFSFYDLAAIHGYPFEQWRGVKNKPPQQITNGFYCTHGSTVFPTWHRLYIHMFEQAIFRRMADIAANFTENHLKDAHMAALNRFRFPYWDPCLPRTKLAPENQNMSDMWDMPKLLKSAEVYVIDTDGTQKRIRNPLLNSNFPTSAQYVDTGRQQIDWANKSKMSASIAEINPKGHSVTLRSPTADGVSSDILFRRKLQRQYAQLSVDLFQMLHPDRQGDSIGWDVFANHWEIPPTSVKQGKRWPSNKSLESWHDDIHVLVGSGNSTGHMAVVPVAAFDPIFWLHHNNIDRMFALYQSMYEHLPDRFVADTAVPPNVVQADSPLAPFVKTQTNAAQDYYDSKDVEDWTGLGFAIPGDKHLDQDGRDAVAKYIMNVYEWSTDRKTRPVDTLGYPRDVDGYFALSGKDFDIDASKPVEFLAIETHEIKRQVFASSGAKLEDEPLDVSFNFSIPQREQFPEGSFVDLQKAEMRTWSVLMRVKKYAFRKSFSVELFIGKDRVPPPNEGSLYLLAPNVAGFSSVFAFDPQSECDNCRDNRDMIYGDTISITAELREYLASNTEATGEWPPAELRTLESFEPGHVVPFLTKNLEWRIVMPDGRVASEEEVGQSELELLVADSIYTYPLPENDVGPLGKYEPWTTYPDVTQGKIGGYVG